MLPDRVSNPGPLTYESGALPIALRGPALVTETSGSEAYMRSQYSVKTAYCVLVNCLIVSCICTKFHSKV